jgi:hypothetical protein
MLLLGGKYMIKKGFALISRSGKYLYFNQVDDNGVEVYETSDVNEAHLFDTIERADHEANSMISRNGNWRYILFDEEIPIEIVEVTTITHVEQVRKYNW